MEKWNGHLYNWYDTRILEPPASVICVYGGQREFCLLSYHSG